MDGGDSVTTIVLNIPCIRNPHLILGSFLTKGYKIRSILRSKLADVLLDINPLNISPGLTFGILYRYDSKENIVS